MARLISRLCTGPAVEQARGGHDPLAGHVSPRRPPGRTGRRSTGPGPRYCPLPRRVGPVQVDQRGVEAQRRHGDELLAVGVRRADRAQLRVDPQHVGAEPGPDRQERQPVRGGEQAPVQHALVQLGELDGAGLAGQPEVRLERDRVQGDETADHPAHLAGGAPAGRRRGRRRRRSSGRSGRIAGWPGPAPSACAGIPSRRSRSSCPERSSPATSSALSHLVGHEGRPGTPGAPRRRRR